MGILAFLTIVTNIVSCAIMYLFERLAHRKTQHDRNRVPTLETHINNELELNTFVTSVHGVIILGNTVVAFLYFCVSPDNNVENSTHWILC